MEALISDEEILERSKLWSNVMEKFCKEEQFEEIAFNEIDSPSQSDHGSDDNSPNQTIIDNKNENTCNALVKVNNFEGETSSDDFEECAGQAMAVMKEHRKKWERCGMMDVLQTFDVKKISKLVTPWIEKNKLNRTQLSSSIDEHIVHIEEHHHRQIHLDSDSDSLHSLDTANYIRSSRKNKKSSCTTTTIKKFSFVKGSRRHLQKKFGFDLNKDFSKVLFDKHATTGYPGLREISGSHVTPPSQPKAIEYQTRSVSERRKKSRQLKRRSDYAKRSVSSSSSSSGSPIRPTKPKFRRIPKINSAEVHKPNAEIRDSPIKQQRLSKNKVIEPSSGTDTHKPSSNPISLEKSQPHRLKNISATTSQGGQKGGCLSNETRFLGASMINSTALPNTNQLSVPNPAKKCSITPIKSKQNQENSTETRVKSPITTNKSPPIPSENPNMKNLKVQLHRLKKKNFKDIKEIEETKKTEEIIENMVPTENSRILLYCPTNLVPHKQYVSGKRFYLTRDYFFETVGKKNSRRFIKLHSKKFPFEFNISSKIYFQVPDESEESASSDEDVLYMFGREGKLIVEPEEQTNGECV